MCDPPLSFLVLLAAPWLEAHSLYTVFSSLQPHSVDRCKSFVRIMHFLTFLTSLALVCTTGWASYVLEDDYFTDGDFFDKFSFWDSSPSADGEDPTHGFVYYENHPSALDKGLIKSSRHNAMMTVDSTNEAPHGRPAVRITSKKMYQSGLIILDVEHMPAGICGNWPSFWTTGPNWPSSGEIDIIEGVNDQTCNMMTLHTGEDCSLVSDKKLFSGSMGHSDCKVVVGGENKGCGIETNDTQTYGKGLNAIGGGVFATEWNSDGISMYFFPRGAVPKDIESGSPVPSRWGMPVATFNGGCDYPKAFTSQQIVFTNTFCGDWAGNVWGDSCGASTGESSCEAYVQNNPKAFQDAYWSVNGLKVYQNQVGEKSVPAPAKPYNNNIPRPDAVPILDTAPSSDEAPAPTSEPFKQPAKPRVLTRTSFVTLTSGMFLFLLD